MMQLTGRWTCKDPISLSGGDANFYSMSGTIQLIILTQQDYPVGLQFMQMVMAEHLVMSGYHILLMVELLVHMELGEIIQQDREMVCLRTLNWEDHQMLQDQCTLTMFLRKVYITQFMTI